MSISPYFRHLKSAYAAELDDMRTDSDGKNVLDKRLTQRRKELKFLVAMLETCPEMVATAFHKGFRFGTSAPAKAAMEHIISHESDELPEWDTINHAFTLEAWTKPLVDIVLKDPLGEWFLTVTAGLEYLNLHHHLHALADGEEAEESETSEEEDAPDAGEQWLVEQGFDAKG